MGRLCEDRPDHAAIGTRATSILNASRKTTLAVWPTRSLLRAALLLALLSFSLVIVGLFKVRVAVADWRGG